MGPVLPAVPRRKTFAQKLNMGIESGLSSLSEMMRERQAEKQMQQEDEALKRAGIDLSGISDPRMRQLYVASKLKGLNARDLQNDQINSEENFISSLLEDENTKASNKFNYRNPEEWSDKQIDLFRSMEGKTPKSKTLANMAKNEFERRQEAKSKQRERQENISPFEGALKTIEEMEKLGSRGNLGIGTSARSLISPQTRRDAAEYERLGKSLISYASNIPIRNRQEFETLAHDLYDPSISDDAREGILSAMKKIIKNSINSYSEIEPEKKERPPLTSFLR